MAGAEAGPPPAEHGGTGQQPEIATLVFNDGSKYTGTLKNGVPHGLGTCVWRDGNQYDGEWKNGVMHGFGTYLWTSGQRYDGEWKEGKRDGVGVKMYADGSTFHGIWRDGKKNGVGVFKPAKDKKTLAKTSSGRLVTHAADGDSMANLRALEGGQQTETPVQPDPHTAALEAAAGPAVQSVASTSEAGAERPREAAGGPKEKDKEREREREQEKEGKLVLIRAFEDGVLQREEKLTRDDAKMIFGQAHPLMEKGRGSKARKKVKRALGFGKKLQQKHGQLLYKGMPGYNLMLRLQHGIRWSIGRGWYGANGEQGQALHPQQSPNSVGGGGGGPRCPIPLSHVLKPPDFTEKVKVLFPSAGSSTTPAHPAGDFKWKDYSPRVFRNLRNMYGIADADYMLSLGGSSALWQLNSPGKSGCMFFLSDDERFLVKTMRKTEIKTLIDMLPKYYSYMETEPQNLVIRFFGVHGVKQVHGRTVRFVVMHNMFNTDLQIHKKFDLKGSTEGRTTGRKVDPNDPKTIFKDLDLDLQFLLDPASHMALIRQINSDAKFLRDVDVMDYSLLLGIHFTSRMKAAQENEAALAQTSVGQSARSQGAPVSGDGPFGAAQHTAQTAAQQQALQRPPPPQPVLEVPPSLDTDEGQRGSPGGRNGVPQSPGGLGPTGSSVRPVPSGGADDPDGEHVRNFDLFSDRPDMEKQLRVFEERMRGLGYGEQRMQDILSLVKLRILGDQLKKRSKKAYKVYDGPTTVLQALASRRHGSEALPRLEEAEESDDEPEEPPPPVKHQPCLGYKMRALAVHVAGDQPPEEVVLCFGVIDILQEWNVRKVLERTFKSMSHDGYAISVAPPKLYSLRFADFLTRVVFMDPGLAAGRGLQLPPPAASFYGGPPPMGRVQTIEEEGDSPHLH